MSDFSVNISGFGDLTKRLNELGVKADEKELASLFEYETLDKGIVKVDDFAKEVAALYDTNDYVAVCTALDEAASLYGDNDFLSVGDIETAQENDFNELIQNEDVRNILIEILNGHVSIQNANLARIEDKNDGFTKFFDGVVGLFGGDKSTTSAQKEIDDARALVSSLQDNPEKLPEVYKKITGNDLTPEELERICNTEQNYSKSELSQTVNNYQKLWNDKAGIDVGAMPATYPVKAQKLQDAINETGIKVDTPDSKILAAEGRELKADINIKIDEVDENAPTLDITREQTTIKSQKFFNDKEFRAKLDRKMGDGFSKRFESLCKNINCEPEDLLAVMCSESGLDPSAVNEGTNATGLIQIMPSTAEELGITTDELANMSAVEQLDYVEEFFRRWNGNKTPDHKLDAGTLYTTVFLPAYRNYDDNAILCREGDNFYTGNEGLDMNRDGVITKLDITNRLRSMDINEFVI